MSIPLGSVVRAKVADLRQAQSPTSDSDEDDFEESSNFAATSSWKEVLRRPAQTTDTASKGVGNPQQGTTGELVGAGGTMTESDDRGLAGMKKKWQRHFSKGKFMQCGKYQCQTGVMVVLSMVVVWSQLLFPTVLDSKVLFEAVISRQDQLANTTTYQQWLHGLNYAEDPPDGQYRLLAYHLWNITNPQETLMLGYRPSAVDAGPFGYVRHSTKYDVEFSADDSQYVSYKTWDYLEPVENLKDCYHMYFRMGKAGLQLNTQDCPGTTCDCASPAATVTVVNPPFLRILHEYTPAGMMSLFAQEAFAYIHDSMVNGFVSSVRSYLMPTVLKERFRFRQTLRMAGALQEIYQNIADTQNSSYAVTSFVAVSTAYSVDCLTYSVPLYTQCPWGVGQHVQDAGIAAALGSNLNLSATEAQHLLGLTGDRVGCIFDTNSTGMPLWLGAAAHLGRIVETMPGPNTISHADAYSTLMAAVCSWGTTTDVSTCQAKVFGVAAYLFDVWFTETSLSTSVVSEWVSPLDVACDGAGGGCLWPMNTTRGLLGLSENAAANIISPGMEDSRNYLSIYQAKGLNYWSEARAYCTMNISCTEASSFINAATYILPRALAQSDGWGTANLTSSMQEYYFAQVCNVASYLFEWWALSADWHQDAVAKYLNDSLYADTDFEITGDNMEDIGYVQWSGGYVTQLLLQVPSVSLLLGSGVWNFMQSRYTSAPPEFWGRAAIAGYPNITIDVLTGRRLLQVLARDDATGEAFRQHVIKQSTTWHGYEGPAGAEKLNATDVLFTTENPYANFSAGGDYSDVLDYLSESFPSSGAQCAAVEAVYTTCLTVKDWAQDCSLFHTIMSPGGTLDCNRAQVAGHGHPYPKKPGNVLARMIYELVWTQILEGGYLVCSDPSNCDYSKGGFFTKQLASDVLFDGYTDPLVVRLLNKQLAPRNMTVRCLQREILEVTEYCEPTYDLDCTRGGFEVVHDTLGVVLNISRAGDTRALWHSAELTLPHGLGTVRNPVFAIYPGNTWNNETFQKDVDCQQRVMQGDANLWSSCVTQVETGQRTAAHIGNMRSYLGNTSLYAAHRIGGGALRVRGNDGDQFRLFGWKGFNAYRLKYRGRQAGKARLGNTTVTILRGEELLQLNMAREAMSLGPRMLQYPTQYAYSTNFTTNLNIQGNRYISRLQDWVDARDRVGPRYLKDYNGMYYEVPYGFGSTQVLTGYPTFISDPYFYTNRKNSDWLEWQMMTFLPGEATALKHQSFVDVDPVTGRALRKAVRLQTNIRIEANALSPVIMFYENNNPRCQVPTKNTIGSGYGCFIYVPLAWENDEHVMDLASADHMWSEFLSYTILTKTVAFLGGVMGGVFVAAGSLLWTVFRYQKWLFSKRVFVD